MSEERTRLLADEWRNLRDYEGELADLYRDLYRAESDKDDAAQVEALTQILICKEVIAAQKEKIAELQARARRA